MPTVQHGLSTSIHAGPRPHIGVRETRVNRKADARVSTNGQDLTAQKNALVALGVTPEKTFTDQGLTGANRARPGLREALAACRDGDTMVVPKFDRLALVKR